MMKRLSIWLLATTLFFTAAAVWAFDDIQNIPSCQYCGMSRDKFSPTRMLIEYDKGSITGTCGIHCAAVGLAQSIDKSIKSIKVADYTNGQLVDAKKATWVVGANLPGVMAKKSRLAFAGKNDALNFQKRQGGEVVNFEDAITSTYADMWSDTRMIREKRQNMKMKKMKGMH